jgi:hypothetical protein
MARFRFTFSLLAGVFLLLSGCVNRVMTVKTDPPGALVYMNDQEIGRTPLSKEFLWYGNYDVVVRKDGYQTIKTSAAVPAPWWQWIPLDLVTDLFPLRDEHVLKFALEPVGQVDPMAVLHRGEELRGELESSSRTKTRGAATTQSSTRPATQKRTQG